jgi:SWI/SNF-related matrix-associated actin-dependent regulator of chromatin subfamily A-like protein 1
MSDNLSSAQWAGADFLAARNVAYLCDGVGLGKTPQFIRACDIVGAQRITIICPPALVIKTVREFERWQVFGRTVAHVEHSAGRLPECDVLVCSYNLAQRDNVRDKLRGRGCDVLIFDEAHALKTPGSQRTKRIIGRAGIVRTASRVWWCSGTPAPNHCGEYYTFARFAGAWAEDQDAFLRRFCICREDERYGLKPIKDDPRRLGELHALLSPYVLERHGRATDTELHITYRGVEASAPDLAGLDPIAMERIAFAVESGAPEILDDPIIATARRIIGMAKALAVADTVAAELQGSDAAHIVFCQHTAAIDIIAARLGADVCGIIDGRTGGKRQAIIDRYCAGGPRVLICHLASASEGLNLQRASRIHLAEPAWSPAVNEQAIARAYRFGQSRDVTATYYYVAGTPDERVAAALTRKLSDRDARRAMFAARFS